MFNADGITPTLRTMYYQLVGANVIPNEKYTYSSLSRFTTDLRKNDVLPMDCFDDNTRRIIDIYDTYYTPEQYIDNRIQRLINAPANYIAQIPRWYKQPNYVEVWTEKDAMTGILYSLLKDRQVRLVPNRGFSGQKFIHDNLKRLETKIRLAEGGFNAIQYIHIIYLGDFDPSGDNMDNVIRNMFKWARKEKPHPYHIWKLDDGITFERLALTPEQVTEYNLASNPDLDNPESKLYEKLRNDPRASEFVRKYGSLLQFEVDSLYGQKPQLFKKLLLDAVDKYFDQDIYDEVMAQEEHSFEYIDALLKKKIKKMKVENRNR
jgi:hypothetical protein